MTNEISSSKYTRQTVLQVRNWDSPALCSVRTTRDSRFSFVPGQFARIGLPESGDSPEPTLWRAYSMVSHPDDDHLEFFSVTVPGGLFSPKLSALRAGDSLWIEKNPFGFLTLERFTSAGVLWLVSTGTGLSAYLPMLRDPGTWKQFETVVLVHGVRAAGELAYREEIESVMREVNQHARRLVYLPVTSREPWPGTGIPACRITTALQQGSLERAAGHVLEPEGGRIMLCGNPEMVTEMRAMLGERGFAAGRRGNLGNLAVENYW